MMQNRRLVDLVTAVLTAVVLYYSVIYTWYHYVVVLHHFDHPGDMPYPDMAACDVKKQILSGQKLDVPQTTSGEV